MTMRAEKVFKPGAYPTYTYVSRHYEDTDISYELRLKQALRTAGCLTSIIGPSKMGKTILCEKVIGLDNIVEISGADFNENTDFWATVAAKVELPYPHTQPGKPPRFPHPMPADCPISGYPAPFQRTAHFSSE